MVAYRSSSITTWASRTNVVATAPAGIANGDALFLFVIIGAATPPAVTPPAGFSALTGFPATSVSDGSFAVQCNAYVKIAASESGNYTATHATASSQAYMAAFSAPNATTPFSPSATKNSGTTGGTTTMLGLTTTANNSLIIAISQDWGDTANNLSPPTGTTPTFTERQDAAIIEISDGTLATAGATGNKTMTNNSTAAAGHPWQGFLFAMPPAAAAAALVPKPYIKLQAVNRSYTY